MSTDEIEIANPPAVGDIFWYSWGYDQTNVEFWEVVQLSSTGKSAKLRRNKVKHVTGERDAYAGIERVEPIAGEFHGTTEIYRRVRQHLAPTRRGVGVEYSFAMEFGSLTPWRGGAVSQTALGWGH